MNVLDIKLNQALGKYFEWEGSPEDWLEEGLYLGIRLEGWYFLALPVDEGLFDLDAGDVLSDVLVWLFWRGV